MSRTWTLKRALSLIVLLILVMISALCFAGCGSPKEESVSDAGKVVSETERELTIIDQAGREVTVKRDVQSIALCYRVVIRFLLNLGQGDKITGIGKSEPFLEELQPSLRNCADVGKGVADIEALAELGPDLFIHKASDTETLEAIEKIGIPAVGIEVETPEDMLTALDILGKVCGAEDKADELAEFYRSYIDQARELSGTVDADGKKTAIVMGSSIGKVADGSMLQGVMLEAAGAVNCASDLQASELWPTAGAEQILSWDPEYIFITGSGSAGYTPEDIYADQTWSEIRAVKEKHVYTIPSQKDSWEFPGVVSVLGIDYMIHIMYPELMMDEQLEQNVNDFYELAYGRTFSREELGY